MADDDDHESGSSVIFDLNSIFRGDISEMLAKVDSKLASDVVDDMTDAYDMSTLLDIRIKMFRFAKKKLLETVAVPGNQDIDPVFDNNVSQGCLDDAQRMVDEWALIARKGKPRVAMDTIDFLSYVSGECPYFPYKIVRKNPKKGRNGKAGRRSKPLSKNKKQPLIPFTPTRASRDDLRKADDDGNATSDAPASERDTGDNESQSDQSDYETSDVSDNDQPDEVCPSASENDNLNEIPSNVDPTAQQADLCNAIATAEQSQPQGAVPPPAVSNVPVAVPSQALHNVPVVYPPAPVGPAQSAPRAPPKPSQGATSAPQSSSADTQHTTTCLSATSKSTQPVTMTTQTEWDLWGSPISNGMSFISPNKPRASCNCEYNVRLLLDWKREIEKRVEANGEQERARSNYLRGRLANSDDEREKMKVTISTQSRQIAANAKMIAELCGRGVTPSGHDYGARVFACETGNASRSDNPPPRQHPYEANRPRGDSRYPPTVVVNNSRPQNPPPTGAGASIPNNEAPTRNNDYVSSSSTATPNPAPLPQRAGTRGKADRSSGPSAPSSDPAMAQAGTQAQKRNPAYPTQQPSRPVPVANPVPRSSSQNELLTIPSNQVGLRAVEVSSTHDDYARQNRNTPSEPWADDHLSDVELITVPDGSAPNTDSGRPYANEAAPMPSYGPPRNNAPSSAKQPMPSRNPQQRDNTNR